MPASSPTASPLRIVAVLGDITTEDVDVIVNAANSALAGGGGVDGAIHKAAGEEDLQRACRVFGGCETGDAKLTPGFALQAPWIAHTVGPIWQGGVNTERDADLLASCYRRCLELADGVQARSIAFPAISTGVYRFPRPQAATIAVTTLRTHPTEVRLAKLVAFDNETYDLYQGLLDQ